MDEKLAREWFGGVRAASDEGEKALPEEWKVSSLQRARLRVLLRQNACDLLSLCIESVEGISRKAAVEIRNRICSELMEDAAAGIRNREDTLDLMRFLSICREGIGDEEDFADLFGKALSGPEAAGSGEMDETAARIRKAADRKLDDFIHERKRQRPEDSPDGPPLWMDEFEYIDWQMTH